MMGLAEPDDKEMHGQKRLRVPAGDLPQR